MAPFLLQEKNYDLATKPASTHCFKGSYTWIQQSKINTVHYTAFLFPPNLMQMAPQDIQINLFRVLQKTTQDMAW